MDIYERLDWATGDLGVDPAVIPPEKMLEALRDAKAEIERLREELEDRKEALRQLGEYCGCDHVESDDERVEQVRHIQEAFSEQQAEIKWLRASVSKLETMLPEDVLDELYND